MPPHCCPRRTACELRLCLQRVKSHKLGRPWPTACSKAPHPTSRTSEASCSQSRPESLAMIKIPAPQNWRRRPATPSDRWASSGCRCLNLPTELSPAEAGVDLEENGQVEVAIAPLAVLVIDAHLLALAEFALLRARRRHVGQRASVVK